MKKHFVVLVFIVFSYSVCAQEALLSQPELNKVAWQWNLGIGFRNNDLSDLNKRLFTSNVSGFTGRYYGINFGAQAVFYERISLGFESNSFINFGSPSAGINDFSLGGGNFGLLIGYNVLKKSNYRLSLNYGLGLDLSGLVITNNFNPTNFEDRINTKTTSTLSSTNGFHRLSVRYDYLVRQEIRKTRKVSDAWGIEAGYYFAGDNNWLDNNANEFEGPTIDNSGFFLRIVYSHLRNKLK